MSSRSHSIDPLLRRTRPAMALSVVVLPAPLEPSRATTVPGATSSRSIGDADEIAVPYFQIAHGEPRHGEASRASRLAVPLRPR